MTTGHSALAACAEMLWRDRPIVWHRESIEDHGLFGPVGMEAVASGGADTALEAFRNAFTV